MWSSVLFGEGAHACCRPSSKEARLNSQSEPLLANVELVKTTASELARLRRGEVSRVRLIGLADADPERRSLVLHLVDYYRAVLGSDVAVISLPFGDGFELVDGSARGDVVEIDILGF